MRPFLSPDQIAFYEENGYLIIKDFLASKAITILKERTQKIVADFHPKALKIFTTEDQTNHMDRYFLASGDRVHCFFEEGAISSEGQLKVPKEKAINKIGHAMHDLLPEFEAIAYSENLYSIAKSLGLEQPSIVQSQYIFKQPEIGAKVNPHIDSTFIYTDPLSCFGAWIALEDATTLNGCLSTIPGSHKLPPEQRFIRNKTNTGTEFIELGVQHTPWDLKKMKTLAVKKGDLILLHGQVVHASGTNRSQDSRHAFVLHLVDLACNWPANNWLQRSEDLPFRAMKNVVYHRFPKNP